MDNELYNLEARREAREEYRTTHGRIDSPMTWILERIAGHGGDDEYAPIEGGEGSCMRIGRHLLYQDSQGFVTSERAPTLTAARDHIEMLNAEAYADDEED